MGRRKRSNPHETQAKVGALLAVIGVLSTALLAAAVFRHFKFEEFAALYVENSLRFWVIVVATLVGFSAGSIGFLVSLSSAGQKRNELSGLAWKMFFVNAAVVAVTLCLFVVFFLAREPVYLPK